jgi:3-oxoacyl-(acyl-carrier-protein) synthase
MGAIAAVEAAICALTVYHQIIPPTANLEEPEEGCDLDYVREGARPYPVRAALNLNMGFGGKASAVILGRYPLL